MKRTRHKKYVRRMKPSRTRRRRLRGGFGVDPRTSILPGPISDMFNSLKYSITQTNDTLAGSYKGVDPSWIKQPALAVNIM